jgi:tetratricopeptide (TPR) repeat protein
MPPLSVIRASIWSNGTRTGQLVASLLRRLAKPAADPVDWRGMATFTGKTVRGDDPRLGAVYRNYEANLRDIVGVASGKGIKIILATVVANLRDCPPFASLHAEGTGASQLDAWSRSYGAGIRQWELGMPDKAISSLNEALKIDPQYAESHYVLGRLLDDRGEKPGARAHYLQALHWDALRFRPDAPINAIARRVASESPGSVLLVDSALEMGSDEASAGPPSGQEVLLEHVHFNWDGNVRLARMLAEKAATLLEAGGPRAPWLDSTGCAAAIGYTGFGRLTMLRLMGPIWGKPPFTNQVGFGEDQARRAHDLSLAAEEATSPEGLARARGQIEAALVRDPDNASLSLSLSEVDAESNQPGPSLLQIDRVLDLEPRSPELLVRRGRLLAALGRLGEAQAAVLDSIRLDPYHLPSYTALVEVLRKTGDFGAGRTTFAGALAGNPDSGYVRLAYADLLFFHGDRDLAVGECQTVLARDPGNADALGRLASLYTGEGRTQEAFDLMARARKTQPFNFENNLALARIYQERGNEDNVADCLTAATQSGPADVSAYLFLAHHFKKLNRQDDALLELARANRVATLNGNLELAKRISAEIESSSNDN